jgi:type I restriction enzyme R subunit
MKKFGLLIDYRGILKELDATILDYQDLAARTQGGYDINDLTGLYTQMSLNTNVYLVCIKHYGQFLLM